MIRMFEIKARRIEAKLIGIRFARSYRVNLWINIWSVRLRVLLPLHHATVEITVSSHVAGMKIDRSGNTLQVITRSCSVYLFTNPARCVVGRFIVYTLSRTPRWAKRRRYSSCTSCPVVFPLAWWWMMHPALSSMAPYCVLSLCSLSSPSVSTQCSFTLPSHCE